MEMKAIGIEKWSVNGTIWNEWMECAVDTKWSDWNVEWTRMNERNEMNGMGMKLNAREFEMESTLEFGNGMNAIESGMESTLSGM